MRNAEPHRRMAGALLSAIVVLVGGCSTREGGHAPRDGGARDATLDARDGSSDARRDGSDGSDETCELDAVEDCYGGNPSNAGVGGCALGVRRCTVLEGGIIGWDTCTGWTPPLEEVCGTDIDEDCDGVIDEEPDGSACVRDEPCWAAGTYICQGADGCGLGYTPCAETTCVDPPEGSLGQWSGCCSYHYYSRSTNDQGQPAQDGVAYFCD